MTSRCTFTDCYSITLAQPHHLPLLGDIERAAAQVFPVEDVPEPIRSSSTPIEDLRESQEAGRLWVAVDGAGTPVGFAHVILIEGQPHLDELDVHPAHGRQGLGRRLVQVLLEWARANGYRRVTLVTYAHIPWNAPFYERLGFAALPHDDLSEDLADLRAEGCDLGLVLDKRVVMRAETRSQS